MSKSVVIVDYQLSNLKSVEYACKHVGLDFSISSDPSEIAKSDGIILPGIGAFGDAMRNLDSLKITPVLLEKIANGTPLMGVCLGLQLLFTHSEEFGNHKGLNIIPGTVTKFPEKNAQGENMTVPQIAWNQLDAATMSWEKTPFSHLSPGEYVYFVHSFYVKPEDSSVILSNTTYQGFTYCSSVLHKNVFAVQFHPEKSGEHGVNIYAQWAKQFKVL